MVFHRMKEKKRVFSVQRIIYFFYVFPNSVLLKTGLTLAILSLFVTTPIISQTRQLDSLLTVYRSMPEDTAKVNTMISIIRGYLGSSKDYNKVCDMAWKQLQLSNQLHYERGVSYAYSSIGLCYGYNGNKEMAMYFFKNALAMMIKRRDKNGKASVYNNLGNLLLSQGNFVGALNSMLTSLRIREEMKDPEGIASCYLNIGNIYQDQGRTDEALTYYSRASQQPKMANYATVAGAYANMGNVFRRQEKYNEALAQHIKAIHIWEKINGKMGMANSYNNIGTIYHDQNKFELAHYYHQLSYDMCMEIGDKTNLAYANLGLGDVSMSTGNYKEALNYFEKTLNLGTELNNVKLIQNTYDNFASVYSKMNNYKLALQYTQLFNRMKDSLLSLKNRRQLADLSTRFEAEKRSREIQALTKEKKLNLQVISQQRFIRWVLIIGLILLSFLILGVYRRYLFKQRANLVLTKTQDELYKVIEQKEKLTSILAHDLKTPLRFMTTVSSFLNKNIHTLKPERLEKLTTEMNTAAKNTYAFADELLMWLSVQQKNFTIVNSQIDLVELILELQLFFQDIASQQQTTIKSEVPDYAFVETDKRLLKIILRNLLDNAVKNTNRGEILFFVKQTEENVMEICIKDTGQGMSKEQLEMLDLENAYGFQFSIKNKLGFQIIKDLSMLIRSKLKVESIPGSGTTVTLQIPVEKKSRLNEVT